MKNIMHLKYFSQYTFEELLLTEQLSPLSVTKWSERRRQLFAAQEKAEMKYKFGWFYSKKNT